ncbi:SMI1/KNR4 family protein [Kutzneria chonburiensis]|uniref:SMI1/KNR4 family protein n=1 Tax=Kutzneria chonburiensis TaxID=1483604 RepID=A0ABV6N1Q2_9PSEU|nr:SMI1/KNR4 family protein [Kutzneria chonburiensis]
MEKLLSIGGDALSSVEPPGPAAGDSGAWSLDGLLLRKNGFYAFESALHVYASGDSSAPGRSIEEWNDGGLWKRAYGGLVTDGRFFAEDVFGGQFVLVGSTVYTFNPETAELSPFAEGVGGWAAEVLDQYDFVTGYSVAHAWQQAHGALPVGHRLVPRIPFVLGGEFVADNMVSVEAAVAMRYMGRLANELSDLPDGARIKFDRGMVDSLACARWTNEESPCVCFGRA